MVALQAVIDRSQLPKSLEDPRRKLSVQHYLSVFLFGLFNPVVESMRDVCQLSGDPQLAALTGGRRISLGSFSEIQAVLDPMLLHEVFKDLVQSRVATPPRPEPWAALGLIAQDGSLWRALPRMSWAEYGVGPKGEAKAVRLHLRFDLGREMPVDARITTGKGCERSALRKMLVPGQTTVGDRYYGADYKLMSQIQAAGAFFVFRIKESAVVQDASHYPLSPQEAAAGILSHQRACLGAHLSQRSISLRLIRSRRDGSEVLLATNLSTEQASATLVAQIYTQRWAIELYFKWLKCILRCRHFFAESSHGVAIQIYLALIASVLMADATGQRPTPRMMKIIHWCFLGMISVESAMRFMAETHATLVARRAARKKKA